MAEKERKEEMKEDKDIRRAAERRNVVIVGKYSLYRAGTDTLFIEHQSGERIEVSEVEIKRFYDSRF